jgi:hypothetical protein
MLRRKIKVLYGGKMSREERKAILAWRRSQARDLTCLRNEFRSIRPGEEYTLSEASLRALERMRTEIEKYYVDAD